MAEVNTNKNKSDLFKWNKIDNQLTDTFLTNEFLIVFYIEHAWVVGWSLMFLILHLFIYLFIYLFILFLSFLLLC